MEHNPSWEANNHSASQDISLFLCNPKNYYRSPPPVPILSQKNPFHNFSFHFSKIHSNIVPPTPRSSEFSSIEVIRTKFRIPCVLQTCPSHLPCFHQYLVKRTSYEAPRYTDFPTLPPFLRCRLQNWPMYVDMDTNSFRGLFQVSNLDHCIFCCQSTRNAVMKWVTNYCCNTSDILIEHSVSVCLSVCLSVALIPTRTRSHQAAFVRSV